MRGNIKSFVPFEEIINMEIHCFEQYWLTTRIVQAELFTVPFSLLILGVACNNYFEVIWEEIFNIIDAI